MNSSLRPLVDTTSLTHREWGIWNDSVQLTELTSSFIEKILDAQGKIDFSILARLFQENPIATKIYFEKQEDIDTILFPFLDFLKSSFFAQDQKISEKIMRTFEDHSIIRDGIFRYIEYNNAQVMDLDHTEQDNTLAFHILLLENKEFNIRKDIETNQFMEINKVFQKALSRIYGDLGIIKQWPHDNPPIALVRDILSFLTLAETINKLALIYTASLEEFQVSLRIGGIIRANVNSLTERLSETFMKHDPLIQKLVFLSWKVQCNFAHLSPINGASPYEIEAQVWHIKTELDEWYNLQQISLFWWDPTEELSSEKIRDGNGAIAELLWIQQIEKSIWGSSPVLENRKAQYLLVLCDMYSFCANTSLFDGESVIEHFVTHDKEQSHDALEAIYYIVLFDTTLTDRSLLRLMEFFQWQMDKKSNKNFLYEEHMIKIIAHVINALHSSPERVSFFDSIEKIRLSLEGKNISHSILSYSKVYLALALYYIESQHGEENAKNAFIHYQNLTTRNPVINKKIVLNPDEYYFYKILGEKREKKYRTSGWISSDELVDLGKIILDEYNDLRRTRTDLAMERKISRMVTNMNVDHSIYSQNHFNQELWGEIARDTFYHICTITIIGDCQNCNKKQHREECHMPEQATQIKIESCPGTPSKRGFAKANIDLNGEVFIVFTYPTNSEQIFGQIFSKNKESIKQYFLHLITTNNKNIQVLEANRNYKQLAFENAITGLLNVNSLKQDLETKLSVNKSIILIEVVEYEALVDAPGGGENAITLIKKVAHSLQEYMQDILGDWTSELYHINEDVFAIVSYESEENIRKFTENIPIVMTKRQNLSVRFRIGFVIDGKESAFDDANIALNKSRHGKGARWNPPYCFVPEDKEIQIQREKNTEILIRSIDHRNTEYNIQPYYQAKVDAHGHLVWVEALARFVRLDESWQKEVISPKSLIDIAIDTGRLPEVTKIMIAKMRTDLQKYPNLNVSFNLHNQDWNNSELWEALTEFAQEVISRGAWVLTAEILETVQLNRATDTQKMKKLKEMDVRLAIDDLGSENTHSTNVRVSEYQFDEMKIDQQVIEKLYNPDTFEAWKNLVLNYVHLAAMFGITKVTAEYVKTPEIAGLLIELWVTQLQGYYFNEPMPLDALAELFTIQTPDLPNK